MADDKRSEEPAASTPRRELRKPGSDREKALTLEVAKLFGMSPRTLMKPPGSAGKTGGVDPDSHGREQGDGEGDDLLAGDGHAPEGVGAADVGDGGAEGDAPSGRYPAA